MPAITQQLIDALAPNPAASLNGRKISRAGGFLTRTRSEDGSFYAGECSGSGKNPYITSADFLEEGAPVFRCTCPSRQFPCKHALALLYEIMEDKPFTVAPIPEDILQKRAKKAASAKKASEEAASAPKKPARSNNAARKKKLQKQLEGLDTVEKLVRDLMNAGLGSMGGTALKTYRELGRQLGDYYLPGPQRLLNRLILEIEGYQADGGDAHYQAAAATLVRLWSLTKKSRAYLQGKLDANDAAQDANPLFEELGGVWKLSELSELGLVKKDVRLIQLAFWVTRDDARGEFIDTGCWADLSDGEVAFTLNYRPFKALKHVKQDDTVFGIAKVSEAAFYPGDGNRRVRWEAAPNGAPGASYGGADAGDCALLREKAAPAIAPLMKTAKNVLKGTMADPYWCCLLRFDRIGLIGDAFAVRDASGDTCALGDCPGLEPTTHRLGMLPDASLLADRTLLGAVWYDGEARRMKIQPLSIVTETDVVRLLY